MKDEILSELWDAKDEIGRTHDYDIDKLFVFFKAAEPRAAYDVTGADDTGPLTDNVANTGHAKATGE